MRIFREWYSFHYKSFSVCHYILYIYSKMSNNTILLNNDFGITEKSWKQVTKINLKKGESKLQTFYKNYTKPDDTFAKIC